MRCNCNRKRIVCLATLVVGGWSTIALADPMVTRLNPPSALFAYGDPNPPYISRFVPGQRFDLQATIQADPSANVSSAGFSIDGTPVPGDVTITPIGGDAFSATLRAHSVKRPGVYELTVDSLQSDGAMASATGNFEIVGLTPSPGPSAKNIIFLIGDGMGIAHRTAARLIIGNVQLGKAEKRLAMDTLPYTALLNVASLNSIVTDSAPGAACYSTGNKSNNNQEGVFPDDTPNSEYYGKWDNPRVEHMGSYLARTQGKALGIVTTADVEDATPAAFAVYTQDRGAGTGICDMYLDEAATNHNLRVLMGGGRKWFIPQGEVGSSRVASTTSGGADYVLPGDVAAAWGVPAGAVDPARDLITDFQAAGFYYAADNTAMDAAPANTKRLLGLFASGHMDVALDKIGARRGGPQVGEISAYPDQPMLDEMTAAALLVLSRNDEGFVLMVEAASIDKQAHNMDTERWIADTIEFDRAIQASLNFQAEHPDTLIMVTADHECAGINIIGGTRVDNATLQAKATAHGADGVPGTNDGNLTLRNGVVGTYTDAGFPTYTIAADGYPETFDTDKKVLIGYAASGDRYEDWLTNPAPYVSPVARDTEGDFFIAGQATGAGVGSAVHTGSDIPLSAGGPGAARLTGVMDNTDVFFTVMQAASHGAQGH